MNVTYPIIINGEPQFPRHDDNLVAVDYVVPELHSQNFSSKLLKYCIAAALVMIAVAVFYYLAVFMPSREQVKVDLELTKMQVEQEAVLRNQILLAGCLNQAEVQWLSVASLYENVYNTERENGSTQLASAQFIASAIEKNDQQLQQNKDNCFKQFPQASPSTPTGLNDPISPL